MSFDEWYQVRSLHGALMREVLHVPKKYKHERARLESFSTDSWPSNAPVTVQDLAKAGFYYLGNGDRVRCYYCSGVLYGWADGDTAIGEHRKHFPQCEFVQRYDTITATTSPESCIQLNTHVNDDRITLDNWRASNAVQTVRELNIYSPQVIECAVKQLLINDDN